MKRLLLLFIPLMFFFGCETEEEDTTGYNCAQSGCVESGGEGFYQNLEDCESNCNCDCGIVTDIVYTEPDPGYLVYDEDNNTWTEVGGHDGYTLPVVQNNCSGNISAACADLEIGQIHCMDYICVLSECYFFNIVTGSFESAPMLTDCVDLDCDCEPIPFE